MNSNMFLGIGLIVVGILFFIASIVRFKNISAIKNAMFLNLTVPSQGEWYGKFRGVVEADKYIIAPFSGSSVVVYKSVLSREETKTTRDSDGDTHSHRTWRPIAQDNQGVPFRIVNPDGYGVLEVDPNMGTPNFDMIKTHSRIITDERDPLVEPFTTKGFFGKLVREKFKAEEFSLPFQTPIFFIGLVEYINNKYYLRNAGKKFSTLTYREESSFTSKSTFVGILFIILFIVLAALGVVALTK